MSSASPGRVGAAPSPWTQGIWVHSGQLWMGRNWCQALVYRPAVSEESLTFLRAATSGRCVVVLTSDEADPHPASVAVPDDTLQLGWHTDDVQRWHSAAEVSDAALAVLADGAPRILGAIRPWSSRP